MQGDIAKMQKYQKEDHKALRRLEDEVHMVDMDPSKRLDKLQRKLILDVQMEKLTPI